MHHKFFIPLLISLISYSNIAVAETNWYSIEYIVFKNNLSQSLAGEPWTGDAIAPLESPVYPHSAEAKTLSISELTKQQQELQGIYLRLQKLTHYTPIRHGGWIQAVSKDSSVVKLSVMPAIEEESLQGTLSFRRGRFLHLAVDLQLTEAAIPSVLGEPSHTAQQADELPSRYRLIETRRIKTQKLHYFDHPRFGVIIKVNPLSSP